MAITLPHIAKYIHFGHIEIFEYEDYNKMISFSVQKLWKYRVIQKKITKPCTECNFE